MSLPETPKLEKITVCVLGNKGVGKSTFIKKCLGLDVSYHISSSETEICGKHLNISVIDDPFPSELCTAKVVLILFDVTDRHTFLDVSNKLNHASTLAPKAFVCVVGNKADLLDDIQVHFKEANDKCLSLDNHIIYFHVSAIDSSQVIQCFWDIISRPLIYKHVCDGTQNEAREFLQTAMLWCVNKGCFQLLTHLRSLGYPISQSVIATSPIAVAKYLFSTYPPIVVPSYRALDLGHSNLYDDFNLDDPLTDLEESMKVVDNRPSMEFFRLYAIIWKDIHLLSFSEHFLKHNMDISNNVVHVDLSHNKLLRIPEEVMALPNLESLNVSHNELHSFPGPDLWRNSNLAILNISHNKIHKGSFPTGGSLQGVVNTKLWYLDISYNGLRTLPLWVLYLHGLRSLHLEHNKKMMFLPGKLSSLPKINSIHTEGLKLIDPPLFIAQEGFESMKMYMQHQALSNTPWNFLRLMIVGPPSSGKSYLSARLRNVRYQNHPPTKGIQIDEWKFQIREFLSFRRDFFQFDLWDFGGLYPYSKVYHYFPTKGCVHILVLSICNSHQELFEWLIDIQCRSSTLIPVIIVFTHVDTLTSKHDKETICNERLMWIGENVTGQRGLTLFKNSTSDHGFTSSLRVSAKEFAQRRNDVNMYMLGAECTHQTGSAAHLMPAVMGVAFVSNVTSQGVQQLRNRLYKMLTEPLPTLSPLLGPLGMGVNVPSAYVEISQHIYNLRIRNQRSSNHNNDLFLYSIVELEQKLFLQTKKQPPPYGILPVVKFMDQCGLVSLHKMADETFLVALNPQLIGNIIARILRITSAENSKGYIPTTHLHMILGEPSGTITKDDFLHFLHKLNLFVTIDATTVVPSQVPTNHLIKDLPVDIKTLDWKRSYFLCCVPSNFWSDLATMLLVPLTTSLTDIEHSFSSGIPCDTSPVVLSNGAKVYVWENNVSLFLDDGAGLYVCVDYGCHEAQTHNLCRRVDVRCNGGPEIQEKWMSIISSVFETVLTDQYPGLLRSDYGNSLVDDFIPLPKRLQRSVCHENKGVQETPERRTRISNNGLKHSQSYPGLDGSASYIRSNSEAAATKEGNSSSIFQWIKANEVAFSCTTAVIDEVFGTDHIPFSVWECLEIAYHSTVVMHCGIIISLEEYLPEIFLSFKLLPHFRHSAAPPGMLPMASITDSYLLSDQEIRDSGGFYLRHFYKPFHKEICLKHAVCHSRMLCLRQCIEEARDHFTKLKELNSDYIVRVCGVNISPPTVALELAPYGSLRSILKDQPDLLNRSRVHHIILQICKAINYLADHSIHYHSLQSENILIWTLDPLVVRLSDAGVLPKMHKCPACNVKKEIPKKAFPNSALDIYMLGILSYELATGERPFENIHPLPLVVMGMLQGHLEVNIEAALELRRKSSCASSCSKTCLQMFMNECFDRKYSYRNITQLVPKLSLCSGENCWSPLKTCVNIECIENSTGSEVVHWASGSRGLVVGTLNPVTGEMNRRILQAPPTPTSGLFANRKGRPAPIAVGRASAIAIVEETQQLWIGTENGSMGSVYVFNLPDMETHYYLHMPDAVLCLLACNDSLLKLGASERSKHSVLVGLANGTIQIFTGHSNDGITVCHNPLQSQRQIIPVPDRLSCLSMAMTTTGDVWCACSDTIQILDTSKLQFRDRFAGNQHRRSPSLRHGPITSSPKSQRRAPQPLSSMDVSRLTKLQENMKADLIVLLLCSYHGVWSVARRGTTLKLWDFDTNKIKAELDIVEYFDDFVDLDDNITALATQGQVLWVGTREGRLLLIDISSLQPNETPPLLGLQQYRTGLRVKCIVPTRSSGPSVSLSVVCSLEQDEFSSVVLTWEYQNRYR